MDNVVQLFVEDTADNLLEDMKGKFDQVMVLGMKDGSLHFVGNGNLNVSQLVYWLEAVKLQLMLKTQE